MKVRYLLLAATLLGALSGFVASRWTYRDPLAPIATYEEPSEANSIFFRFRPHPLPVPSRIGKNHDRVKEPFREVLRQAAVSTVRIRNANEQLCLGVVVDPAGYVLTKHSELQGSLWCIVHGGQKYPAEVRAVADDLDLAILKIEATNLTPIQWTNQVPALGSWLAMPDGADDLPIVLGVVGSPAREIPEERAILGVILEESDQGPRIERVLEQSMADRIGLQSGDVILGVNQQSMRSSAELIALMSSLRPGDRVDLEILRDGTSRKLQARLGRVSELIFGDQEFERELDRDLSLRRGGFPRAFQHDGVLRADQCGGPCVDVHGRTVGLNIARSGRIATLVLPSGLIQQRLPELLAQAQAAGR